MIFRLWVRHTAGSLCCLVSTVAWMPQYTDQCPEAFPPKSSMPGTSAGGKYSEVDKKRQIICPAYAHAIGAATSIIYGPCTSAHHHQGCARNTHQYLSVRSQCNMLRVSGTEYISTILVTQTESAVALVRHFVARGSCGSRVINRPVSNASAHGIVYINVRNTLVHIVVVKDPFGYSTAVS